MDESSGGKKVRRPMNAFMIYCKRHRSQVREQNPDLDNRNVTRVLGDLWAKLDPVEKANYHAVAKQQKDAFMEANPNYKWHNSEKTAGVMVNKPVKSSKSGGKSTGQLTQLAADEGLASANSTEFSDQSQLGGLGLLLLAHNQSANNERAKLASSHAESVMSSTPVTLQNSTPAAVPKHDIADVSNSRLLQLAEMCTSELNKPLVSQQAVKRPASTSPFMSQLLGPPKKRAHRWPTADIGESHQQQHTSDMLPNNPSVSFYTPSNTPSSVVDYDTEPRQHNVYAAVPSSTPLNNSALNYASNYPPSYTPSYTPDSVVERNIGVARPQSLSPLNLSMQKPKSASSERLDTFDTFSSVEHYKSTNSFRRTSSSATDSLPSPSPPYPNDAESPVFYHQAKSETFAVAPNLPSSLPPSLPPMKASDPTPWQAKSKLFRPSVTDIYTDTPTLPAVGHTGRPSIDVPHPTPVSNPSILPAAAQRPPLSHIATSLPNFTFMQSSLRVREEFERPQSEGVPSCGTYVRCHPPGQVVDTSLMKQFDSLRPEFKQWRQKYDVGVTNELARNRDVLQQQLASGSYIASQNSDSKLKQGPAYLNAEHKRVDSPGISTPNVNTHRNFNTLLTDKTIASLLSSPSTNPIPKSQTSSVNNTAGTSYNPTVLQVPNVSHKHLGRQSEVKPTVTSSSNMSSLPQRGIKKKWVERMQEEEALRELKQQNEAQNNPHAGIELTRTVENSSLFQLGLSGASQVTRAFTPLISANPINTSTNGHFSNSGSHLTTGKNEMLQGEDGLHSKSTRNRIRESDGETLTIGNLRFPHYKKMKMTDINTSLKDDKIGTALQTLQNSVSKGCDSLNPVAACGKIFVDHIVERLFQTDFSGEIPHGNRKTNMIVQNSDIKEEDNINNNNTLKIETDLDKVANYELEKKKFPQWSQYRSGQSHDSHGTMRPSSPPKEFDSRRQLLNTENIFPTYHDTLKNSEATELNGGCGSSVKQESCAKQDEALSGNVQESYCDVKEENPDLKEVLPIEEKTCLKEEKMDQKEMQNTTSIVERVLKQEMTHPLKLEYLHKTTKSRDPDQKCSEASDVMKTTETADITAESRAVMKTGDSSEEDVSSATCQLPTQKSPVSQDVEDSCCSSQPVRKSSRANRGSKYQALITQGIIQPSRERLAARQSVDRRPGIAGDTWPGVAGEEAGSGEADQHTATLQASSKNNSSGMKECAKSTYSPQHPSMGTEAQDVSNNKKADGQEKKASPPVVLTGSRRRKARKHGVTRITVMEELREQAKTVLDKTLPASSQDVKPLQIQPKDDVDNGHNKDDKANQPSPPSSHKAPIQNTLPNENKPDLKDTCVKSVDLQYPSTVSECQKDSESSHSPLVVSALLQFKDKPVTDSLKSATVGPKQFFDMQKSFSDSYKSFLDKSRSPMPASKPLPSTTSLFPETSKALKTCSDRNGQSPATQNSSISESPSHSSATQAVIERQHVEVPCSPSTAGTSNVTATCAPSVATANSGRRSVLSSLLTSPALYPAPHHSHHSAAMSTASQASSQFIHPSSCTAITHSNSPFLSSSPNIRLNGQCVSSVETTQLQQQYTSLNSNLSSGPNQPPVDVVSSSTKQPWTVSSMNSLLFSKPNPQPPQQELLHPLAPKSSHSSTANQSSAKHQRAISQTPIEAPITTTSSTHVISTSVGSPTPTTVIPTVHKQPAPVLQTLHHQASPCVKSPPDLHGQIPITTQAHLAVSATNATHPPRRQQPSAVYSVPRKPSSIWSVLKAGNSIRPPVTVTKLVVTPPLNAPKLVAPVNAPKLVVTPPVSASNNIGTSTVNTVTVKPTGSTPPSNALKHVVTLPLNSSKLVGTPPVVNVSKLAVTSPTPLNMTPSPLIKTYTSIKPELSKHKKTSIPDRVVISKAVVLATGSVPSIDVRSATVAKLDNVQSTVTQLCSGTICNKTAVNVLSKRDVQGGLHGGPTEDVHVDSSRGVCDIPSANKDSKKNEDQLFAPCPVLPCSLPSAISRDILSVSNEIREKNANGGSILAKSSNYNNPHTTGAVVSSTSSTTCLPVVTSSNNASALVAGNLSVVSDVVQSNLICSSGNGILSASSSPTMIGSPHLPESPSLGRVHS